MRKRQEFEKYPELEECLSEMARRTFVGSLMEWNRFTDALNSALRQAQPAPVGEQITISRATLQSLIDAHKQSTVDWDAMRVIEAALEQEAGE